LFTTPFTRPVKETDLAKMDVDDLSVNYRAVMGMEDALKRQHDGEDEMKRHDDC